MNDRYRALLEKAEWCHENRRNVFPVEEEEVTLARLYAYAYRSQTIGAFHGCREALGPFLEEKKTENEPARKAALLLQELQDFGILPVPTDFRCLLHTLYYYDRKATESRTHLEALADNVGRESSERIGKAFGRIMDRVSESNGIFLVKDNTLPELGSFLVPHLGITIVPLIYGDHHSWNTTHLPPRCIDSTNHRHHAGIEIHLGYSPMHGITMLGKYRTEIREGYAMPIPVGLDHGLDNLSEEAHWVPFIFGSMTLGGWGVFYDVEPRPLKARDLEEVPLEGKEMNQSVYLEREIARMAEDPGTRREIAIPASSTASGKIGALELGIARVEKDGLALRGDCYRIISVVKGKAELQIGPVRQTLEEHDHAGIPSATDSRIASAGEGPLVILDAVILKAEE